MCFAMKWHMTPESDLVESYRGKQCTQRQGVLEAGSCALHVNSMIICAQGLVHDILSGPSQSVLDGSMEEVLSDKETEIQNGCHPRSCRWSEGELGQWLGITSSSTQNLNP